MKPFDAMRLRHVGSATDPSFASVALLLHGDGANGGTTFTDSSTYAATPIYANSVTTSNAQSKFGGSSLKYTSNSSLQGLSWGDAAKFTLGTNDFTIEFFIRFDDTSATRWCFGQMNISGADSSTSVAGLRTTGNVIECYAVSGSSLIGDIVGTTAISANTWYFVTYGRQGSTFRLYVDTNLEGTATSSASINDSGDNWGVGKPGTRSSNPLQGYIDEFRFTNGVWRGAPSVPIAPFPDS